MNEWKIIIDLEMMIRITASSSQIVRNFEVKENVVIAERLAEVSLKVPDELNFRFRKYPKFYAKFTTVFRYVLLER